MVRVKSRAEREANYRSAIGQVPAKYKKGVEQASGVIEASKAGQALYEQRMQDQNVLNRRLKGLNKVSDADWKNAALNKGVTRIGSGMEAGAAKQAANYEPYAQALEGVSLPPRTADPMANIDNRTKPVVAAMVRTKEQMG